MEEEEEGPEKKSLDTSSSPSPPALNLSNEQDRLGILRPLLEHCARQFQIPNADMVWELMSFPVKPEFYLQADKEKLLLLSGTLARKLDSKIQNYPDDTMEGWASSLETLVCGGCLLIRNNGSQPFAINPQSSSKNFIGKHVLVCCFHVPYVRPWKCEHFQCLVNLSKELYSKFGNDDFEMVLVARMNILAGEKEDFDRFFSGFHGSCIIVPYEIPLIRDRICKTLGLELKYSYDDYLNGESGCRCRYIFLNDSGKIVDLDPEVLRFYGAQAFPFNQRKMEYTDYIDKKLLKLEKDKWSLDQILRCDNSSPDYVQKFGSRERVSISKLSANSCAHFGLFLCFDGDLIPELAEVFEQCRAAGQQFEIVVVYLPFTYHENVDPDILKGKIDGLMQEFDSCQNWWCLPFDNSVSLRFMRLTRFYEDNIRSSFDVDKLIVVGPDVEELDIYGDAVMRCCGVGSFPFTVEAAYKNPVRMLEEIRLDSLLESGVYRGDVYVPLRDLKGSQMTFIYIDHISSPLESLIPVYHRMKELHYEFVFVEITGDESEYSDVRPGIAPYTWPPAMFGNRTYPLVSNEERYWILSEMPWYTCSWINQSLSTLMRVAGSSSRLLVGFGDDGRLRSIYSALPPFSLNDFTSDYNIEEYFQSLVDSEYDFGWFMR